MPVSKANFTRGTSFLASEEQRERIDAFVNDSTSLGDVMREVVSLGLEVKEGRAKLVPVKSKG